jgi:hypothetical protein
MTQSPQQMFGPRTREPGTTEARPAKGRRLDVRLSSAEHARIVAEAARRGLTVSTYARQALLGQIDYGHDCDTHVVATLLRGFDARLEAIAEMVGEVALTILERAAAEPTSPEDRRTYVAGAVECFRDALRRHLAEDRA